MKKEQCISYEEPEEINAPEDKRVESTAFHAVGSGSSPDRSTNDIIIS